MYGRLVEIEGIDPSRREEAIRNVRENVLPALKSLDGFAGFVSLANEETRRVRSVVLWETREDAEAAEEQMKPRREQMAKEIGFTVKAADLYEVVVAEVPVGAHA
jgi:heme-degrading monooxygenase HmoA